ncbi:hypothetical protein JCM10212_001165 [Sporobolomyces blumeae]
MSNETPDEASYQVERILDFDVWDNLRDVEPPFPSDVEERWEVRYRVKWQGYPIEPNEEFPEGATWEPEANFDNFGVFKKQIKAIDHAKPKTRKLASVVAEVKARNDKWKATLEKRRKPATKPARKASSVKTTSSPKAKAPAVRASSRTSTVAGGGAGVTSWSRATRRNPGNSFTQAAMNEFIGMYASPEVRNLRYTPPPEHDEHGNLVFRDDDDDEGDRGSASSRSPEIVGPRKLDRKGKKKRAIVESDEEEGKEEGKEAQEEVEPRVEGGRANELEDVKPVLGVVGGFACDSDEDDEDPAIVVVEASTAGPISTQGGFASESDEEEDGDEARKTAELDQLIGLGLRGTGADEGLAHGGETSSFSQPTQGREPGQGFAPDEDEGEEDGLHDTSPTTYFPDPAVSVDSRQRPASTAPQDPLLCPLESAAATRVDPSPVLPAGFADSESDDDDGDEEMLDQARDVQQPLPNAPAGIPAGDEVEGGAGRGTEDAGKAGSKDARSKGDSAMQDEQQPAPSEGQGQPTREGESVQERKETRRQRRKREKKERREKRMKERGEDGEVSKKNKKKKVASEDDEAEQGQPAGDGGDEPGPAASARAVAAVGVSRRARSEEPVSTPANKKRSHAQDEVDHDDVAEAKRRRTESAREPVRPAPVPSKEASKAEFLSKLKIGKISKDNAASRTSAVDRSPAQESSNSGSTTARSPSIPTGLAAASQAAAAKRAKQQAEDPLNHGVLRPVSENGYIRLDRKLFESKKLPQAIARKPNAVFPSEVVEDWDKIRHMWKIGYNPLVNVHNFDRILQGREVYITPAPSTTEAGTNKRALAHMKEYQALQLVLSVPAGNVKQADSPRESVTAVFIHSSYSARLGKVQQGPIGDLSEREREREQQAVLLCRELDNLRDRDDTLFFFYGQDDERPRELVQVWKPLTAMTFTSSILKESPIEVGSLIEQACDSHDRFEGARDCFPFMLPQYLFAGGALGAKVDDDGNPMLRTDEERAQLHSTLRALFFLLNTGKLALAPTGPTPASHRTTTVFPAFSERTPANPVVWAKLSRCYPAKYADVSLERLEKLVGAWRSQYAAFRRWVIVATREEIDNFVPAPGIVLVTVEEAQYLVAKPLRRIVG